ncbi:MAG: alpha-hydroxy-acid oxidizing protein, partial [Spirochaetota bacterium]|nr:alpha-hydroxy-acid oxidizing protein [Spirochaetota bacterium]
SDQSEEVIEDAVTVMRQGIRALGLNIGAAKGDIKITSEGAKIVEMAARLSGGFMSAYTYPYATGVNLIENAIKICLGEEPGDLTPRYHGVSVEKAIISKPGIVKFIGGIDEAKKMDGVRNIFLNVQEGDIVKSPTNNVEKSGHIIASADSRMEALKIVNEAMSKIIIETEVEGNITYNELRSTALKNFNKTCVVCKVCDGRECRGQIPGMGGIDTGSTFFNNMKAFQKYHVIPSYLHDVAEPSLKTTLFRSNLSFPLLVAPMTGTETNMGGGLREYDFARAMARGALLAGTMSMVGDGASPDKYTDGLRAIQEVGGRGIPIFKPRADQSEIIKRIHAAEEAGALAVGLDIDAAVFTTMAMKNQSVEPKSIYKIQDLVKSTTLPFILKGILSRTDALRALDTGAKAIVVSNHGGRVMDSMPGTLDVLPEIVDAVRGEMIIMVDGGIRTGLDLLKALALGADLALIGRPAAIGAYGGRESGVKLILDQIKDEFKKAMILTGTACVKDFHKGILRLCP